MMMTVFLHNGRRHIARQSEIANEGIKPQSNMGFSNHGNNTTKNDLPQKTGFFYVKL